METEAFCRREELGHIKRRIEKMSQEKNDENTDLECDLVLFRNMDSKKGGHQEIGSL